MSTQHRKTVTELAAAEESRVQFVVEDFTGQVRRPASVPSAATVQSVLAELEKQLALANTDPQGKPILYGARVGDTVLNPSDRVGDVIRPGDVVTLTKSVTAG